MSRLWKAKSAPTYVAAAPANSILITGAISGWPPSRQQPAKGLGHRARVVDVLHADVVPRADAAEVTSIGV